MRLTYPTTSTSSPAGPAAKTVRDAGPFTLGSVQFGQSYGLGAARSGLSEDAVAAILGAAAAVGVVWIDTARAYGDAEPRIGRWMAANGGAAFRIVSKVPPLTADADVAVAVTRSIDESLTHLGRGTLDICLTHRAVDLLNPAAAEALRRAQSAGRIGRFGASAYTAKDAAAALAVPGIGALQVPLSVVSAALRDAGTIERAARQGVYVFVRSVFLQGALLLPPENLPGHLRALEPTVKRLRSLAHEARVSLLGLLLGAVKSVEGVFSPVLGVDNVEQLQELASAGTNADLEPHLIAAAFQAGHRLPPELTDPRFWPKPQLS